MDRRHSARNVVEQASGFAGGLGGLVGAAVAGLYGAPERAGPVLLAVCIALGAILGGVGCGLAVVGLVKWLGDRTIAVAYMVVLVGALTVLGGVAGYFVTGGRIDAALAGGGTLLVVNGTFALATRRQWLYGGERDSAHDPE